MLKKLALLGVSDDLCTANRFWVEGSSVIFFFLRKEGKLGFLKEPAPFVFVTATKIGRGALAVSSRFAAWRGQGQDSLIPVVFAAPPSTRSPLAAASSRLLYSKNPRRLSLTHFYRCEQLKHWLKNDFLNAFQIIAKFFLKSVSCMNEHCKFLLSSCFSKHAPHLQLLWILLFWKGWRCGKSFDFYWLSKNICSEHLCWLCLGPQGLFE